MQAEGEERESVEIASQRGRQRRLTRCESVQMRGRGKWVRKHRKRPGPEKGSTERNRQMGEGGGRVEG
eukprot:1175815-Rhodomonas_salina.4